MIHAQRPLEVFKKQNEMEQIAIAWYNFHKKKRILKLRQLQQTLRNMELNQPEAKKKQSTKKVNGNLDNLTKNRKRQVDGKWNIKS